MDFERLRRNWEHLGRKDPMWAILTQPGCEGGRWDEQSLFRTGIEFVDWLGSWLGLHGIEVPKGDALDFGCGIGRLTQALAPHFRSVTGIDVSQSMIDVASARNRHGGKVHYRCNPHPDLSSCGDASFDFVLSVIVLQHMRPAYALGHLGEFMRVLRPGGLLVCQFATGARAVGAVAPGSVAEAPDEARMEVHCVDGAAVRAVIAAGGGEILREEPDQWAGSHWDSEHFAVRRR